MIAALVLAAAFPLQGEIDAVAEKGGGKASGPGSLKSPADINLKGSFTIYAAELAAPPSDVVPDLIYTQHYGF